MAALGEGDIAARLRAVQGAVAAATAAAGRPPGAVQLLAVSKTQPAEAVAAALRAGQRAFGENYAQELRDKARQLAAPEGPLWHFIGTLQRNKVNMVVGTAALVHTVDGAELAAALAARARRLGVVQDCLVEVNVGGEAQKGGCAPEALGALLDAISAEGGALRCRGLMCIPPPAEDPEGSRPHFARLRALRDEHARTPRAHAELVELSMGMSHDFAVAIAEGATIVRVGTAIFGSRA